MSNFCCRDAASALDAQLAGLAPLDWLGDCGPGTGQPGSDRGRHDNNNLVGGATRQLSGSLIETLAQPNNSSFLLSFMGAGSEAMPLQQPKEAMPSSKDGYRSSAGNEVRVNPRINSLPPNPGSHRTSSSAYEMPRPSSASRSVLTINCRVVGGQIHLLA